MPIGISRSKGKENKPASYANAMSAKDHPVPPSPAQSRPMCVRVYVRKLLDNTEKKTKKNQRGKCKHDRHSRRGEEGLKAGAHALLTISPFEASLLRLSFSLLQRFAGWAVTTCLTAVFTTLLQSLDLLQNISESFF